MDLRTRFIASAVIALMGIGVTWSQPREWQKEHFTIEMEQVMAEYTEISTQDLLSPDMSRLLYRDRQGVLIVIRSTAHIAKDGDIITDVLSFQYTITQVSNGEEIVFNHDGSGAVTVTIASASFDYVDSPDERPLPQSVKDQARSMLTANASLGFQNALLRLAMVGGRYSHSLSDLGSELAQLFFPSIGMEPGAAVTDHTSEATGEFVADFDPYVTPPGPFEEPFGLAYYE